jgi:aminotransferase
MFSFETDSEEDNGTVTKPQPDIRAIARLIPASGNLVQGQNELPIHPALVEALDGVVRAGLNHYSFFEGVDELRRTVAEKVAIHNRVTVDPDRRPLELIITPGATGGLVAIAQTYLRDSSALLFEPYYPYHKQIVEMVGGRVDLVTLHDDELSLDIAELRQVCAAGARRADKPLKAIIVSSPANPTGRVFNREEMQSIISIAEEFSLLIISDEVYEHFAIQPEDHISPASLPGGFDRTITVNSFSKSWAISGWRLGFAYGPGELVGKIFAAGNVFYVCSPTPLQHALARVLLSDPEYYDRLRVGFSHKRKIIADALARTGFRAYPSRSSFYIWARIPDQFADASELNELLIKEAGLAAVPGSAFTEAAERDLYMRICIARKDEMLQAAAERLVRALG